MNTKKLKKETLISAYDRLDKLTTLQFLKLLAKEVDARQLKLSSVNAGNNITITFDEEGNPIINATGELSVEWNNILNKPLLAELDKENTFTNVQKFRHISGISIYGNEDVTDLARLSITREYFTIVESNGQAHIINIPKRAGTIALREEIDIELQALDGRVESLEDSVSDLDTYKANKEEEVVLWENDDPTQALAQTTLNITTSNYKKLKVIVRYNVNGLYKVIFNYELLNEQVKLSYLLQQLGYNQVESKMSINVRTIDVNEDKTQIIIGNCYNSIIANGVDNDLLIIEKIIGIKEITQPARVKKATTDVAEEGTK